MIFGISGQSTSAVITDAIAVMALTMPSMP